jgi:hypothetical protein
VPSCRQARKVTYHLQVVQGRLFGMGQSKANQWIHVLHVVLQATRRTLGEAPSRSLQALAQRVEVTEAEAAAPPLPFRPRWDGTTDRVPPGPALADVL